ncbi:glycosyltransferase family 2 protein [Loigolactobacillus coryniformis]|uniref:Glycosyltransferase n=1 Tax=Loigolactobacillus coryniformis subsp. torquens DSM 20004 = KCTC 3535 TaxID=1423822 RepID=A0A2D1KMW9_9LACO|nr:glycosyltransferase family 2 protein [Loigolactobacillus coryniformis]ATO43448.1 glycosyltransferase [Loigolactobacillus coryniformis subsp. torquens DSM 20004 = KCTC 3535]
MKVVTVIIPFYNEEGGLQDFYDGLIETLDSLPTYNFEMLFVNDGSSDKGLELIDALSRRDQRVSYIDLSRNYGKEVAMTAGFDYAKGDAVVVIDADLQQPPAVIKEMLHYWEQGFDDVYAIRKERLGESRSKIWFSKTYYRIIGKMTQEKVYPNAGDFRLLDRKVVNALASMREQARYTKGLYGWVGFKKKAISYIAQPRKSGITKWSFSKLLKLAVNGLTAYTTVPLRISTYMGVLVSFFGFIYMLIVLIQKIFGLGDVSGYASLMIGILLLGGVQLISLGVIGEYLARVFVESKQRPLYFIENYHTHDETQKRVKKV